MPAYQHYVPRFYLKGFLDPDAQKRGQNQIWVYRPGAGPKPRSLRRVGGEHGFYEYDGARDIESALSRREDRAARLVSKLVEHHQLRGSDREEFADFLGTMAVRGRWSLDMTLETIERTYEFLDAQGCERQRLKERIINHGPDSVADVSKEFVLDEMFGCGETLTRLFREMFWWLVRPRSEDEIWLTSDVPLTLTDEYNNTFDGSRVAWSKTAYFTLPLDSRHCLVGQFQERGDKARVVANSVVRSLNRQTARNAYREFYACRKSHGLQVLARKHLKQDRSAIDEEKLHGSFGLIQSLLA